jgi:hypothetical protein
MRERLVEELAQDRIDRKSTFTSLAILTEPTYGLGYEARSYDFNGNQDLSAIQTNELPRPIHLKSFSLATRSETFINSPNV